jgi:hypothetical protein
MECSCENSPNRGKFSHSEIQAGRAGLDLRICGSADLRICGSADLRICGSADLRDLRDLRDLNPRLLVLSPYAVELAPQ